MKSIADLEMCLVWLRRRVRRVRAALERELAAREFSFDGPCVCVGNPIHARALVGALMGGPPFEGAVVLHLCSSHGCVEKSHKAWGTRSEAVRTAQARKGRGRPGRAEARLAKLEAREAATRGQLERRLSERVAALEKLIDEGGAWKAEACAVVASAKIRRAIVAMAEQRAGVRLPERWCGEKRCIAVSHMRPAGAVDMGPELARQLGEARESLLQVSSASMPAYPADS